MAWPTPQDYNEAIQNPGLTFADPELRAGAPELTPLGLPRPITGGFASVYRVRSGGREWAVRCFLREFADQQQRYAAIGRHLAAAKLPYTVGFDFLSQGIRIRGRWYPILKMAWAPGEPLHEYVGRHLHDGPALRALAARWVAMAGDLRRAGVAHGDLQHGNVLVARGELRLIDYDGMFVPALAGGRSHEVGHRNYQHPSRGEADFGPHLDNFAAWVIYLSLLALSVEPALWQRLGAGDEQLLLGREDFARPQSSTALQALADLPDQSLQALTARFRAFLAGDVASVPPLDGPEPPRAPRRQTTGGARKRDWAKRLAGAHRGAPPPAMLPSAPGAAWVVDHLRPVAPAPPGASCLPERLLGALFALLAALLLAVALAGVVAPATVAATLGAALGGLVLVCACRFWTLPEAIRKLAALWRLQRARTAVAWNERATGRQRRALAALERDEMAAIAKLAARERGLADEEEAARQRVARGLDAFAARWRALHQAESAERDAALRALRERTLTRCLAGQTVVRAAIPGIGPRSKLRLMVAGVRTAADIGAIHPRTVRGHQSGDGVVIEIAPHHRVHVAGIGAKKARALLAWRQQLEAEARRTLPRALPRDQQAALARQHERRRMTLAHREARAGERARRRQDAIRRKYAARRASHARRLAATETIFAQARQDGERRLAARQRLLARRQWALALARQDYGAYRHVTFGAYLRRVLALPDIV